jgi:hypothetical protein
MSKSLYKCPICRTPLKYSQETCGIWIYCPNTSCASMTADVGVGSPTIHEAYKELVKLCEREKAVQRG